VTLRLRLLLVLAGIMALGLIAADVATYASLRSYLYSQVNQQLTSGYTSATQAPACQGRPTRFFTTPGEIAPPGLWLQVRDASGNPICGVTGYTLSPPDLPLKLPASGTATSALFDVKSENGSNVVYRVLVEPTELADGTQGTAVVAIPLNDLHHTLGRLLLIEVLVTAAVLGGIGMTAWWLVRRGLRPLDQMAATAGRIAAGDLSERVETTDPRTEVGQLGLALNTMLSGIEGAFAARAASEDRLRRFLADASHELRTPLTSIRGYAELFDRGARDRPEDLATSMRHIREEAGRMSVLVDDLLLLARLDRQRPLQFERVDLGAVVRDAVHAARVAAPERTVGLDAPERLSVMGDPDRLRQVVDNLVANAVRHTPTTAPVEVRMRREGHDVCLEVADGGPGVPEAEQAHIFEPFRRADPTRARATGGAGLGLTIVSAIAHAHGGTVGVVSPAPMGGDGPGATFWVRIPGADAGAAANGSAEQTPAEAAPDQTLAIDAKRV
jgi:two-component system OmpR family sensor kinase